MRIKLTPVVVDLISLPHKKDKAQVVVTTGNMNWPKNVVTQVWEKATVLEGYDPDKYRKDACGAWIMRDKFNVIHNYGWEIDHIYPKSLGGNDHPENLRALHYLNNKSKGDDYPKYKVAVSSNGIRNEEVNKYLIVKEHTQKRLYVLFSNKQ